MTDTRITDIEIHLSHLEASLEDLNQTVIHQQQYIDRLENEVKQIKGRIQSASTSNIASASEETPPPHY